MHGVWRSKSLLLHPKVSDRHSANAYTAKSQCRRCRHSPSASSKARPSLPTSRRPAHNSSTRTPVPHP